MLFSFPRGLRRCGAPPSAGRRYAPPPSCAFFLQPRRKKTAPFRGPSPFSLWRIHHATCNPMRHATRFARCIARRVSRRFARRRDACPASRAGWCLCPRAVLASEQGHACTRLNHVKMVSRNVKSEMLKTHRRRRPTSPMVLVRLNSVYYLCDVFRLFNFSPLRVGCRWPLAADTNPHLTSWQKVICF